MQLDVKTLYLLNIVVALVTAGVSFFSWFYHRDMPGLRGWAIGLSLGAAGTVMLSLRTPASPIILAIAGNTLIVAGYATVWMSVRRFNDGVLDLRYVTFPVGLFVVFFTIASLAGADIRDRIAMVSTAIGTLSLLAGREVFNARKQEPLGSRLPTSLAFAFIAIAMIVRAIFALLGEVPSTDSAFYDPTQGSTLFVNTVCLVAVTLGLLMMANERLRRRYEKLASTDELTGLPNRRFFLEHGERLCSRAARDKFPACILLMDLDHFSEVNRLFGHPGGDHALAAFAAFTRTQLRPTDLIGRYGGEEFCVLLQRTDEKEGVRIAERLRTGVANMSIELGREVLRITVSIGLTQLDDDGDLRASIRKADIALYRAKALGRNLVCSTSADRNTAAAL
jgi:diguanylate cyclase (GGDEF)-like protein